AVQLAKPVTIQPITPMRMRMIPIQMVVLAMSAVLCAEVSLVRESVGGEPVMMDSVAGASRWRPAPSRPRLVVHCSETGAWKGPKCSTSQHRDFASEMPAAVPRSPHRCVAVVDLAALWTSTTMRAVCGRACPASAGVGEWVGERDYPRGRRRIEGGRA